MEQNSDLRRILERLQRESGERDNKVDTDSVTRDNDLLKQVNDARTQLHISGQVQALEKQKELFKEALQKPQNFGI